MKKIFFVLAFISCIFSLNAIALDSLAVEKRVLYLENALSIETQENYSYSSGTRFYNIGRSVYGSTYGHGSTTTEWKPYLGASEISKKEFFQIVGDSEMVSYLDEIEAKNKKRTAIGATFTGIGSLAYLVCMGALLSDTSSPNYALIGVTGGLAALGVGIGIPLLCVSYDDNISIQFAVGVADNYNQQLLERLSK